MLEIVKKWTPANKRFLAIGLALAISVQMFVLATEYLSSVWPLWFGSPVTLKTAPIDPRSLFRGNYVRLNYDISTIDKELSEGAFKKNAIGYVTLKEEGDIFVATGLYSEKPESTLFIRGRVVGEGNGYRLKYGIEAYFMPKEKALRAQKSVRQGVNAEIYILPSGKSAIANLDCTSGDC